MWKRAFTTDSSTQILSDYNLIRQIKIHLDSSITDASPEHFSNRVFTVTLQKKNKLNKYNIFPTSPQHLKDLLGHSPGDSGMLLLKALTDLSNFMLSGKVNGQVTSTLYGANLCTLVKKDGGIRPIAMGTTYRCLVAKIGCTTISGPLSRYIQLGFGTTQHTTNTMMTRRATALCTEQKLRQALEELKHTKETCSQLLRERDESEIEIQKIIARNTQLKSELSQLHAQHVDVLQHQENLNETISCYDQQYSSYERTLQRITDLEKELSVANNQIAHYKELEQLQDTVHTENLYQELVGSPGGLSMLYQPLSTNKDNCPHVNNLNFDNSVQCSVETGNLKLSKNKFKKYVKIKLAWKRMKLAAKVNLSHHNKENYLTGGGSKPPSPSPED
ncbi:hypothetical protein ACJJTC_016924 [Scirpophaga incertulas]